VHIYPALLDCKTLPATMFEAKNDACRLGRITTTVPGVTQQQQLDEMFAYSTQYQQIDKLYRNFSAESNQAGQTFGIGCMKNAKKILDGFFAYRLTELDALVTKMEKINNDFIRASRTDLDALEEDVAVLYGGDSEIVNKVKTRRPDLFDYAKQFNNPACTSIMTANDFGKTGKESGLMSINNDLKDTLTKKVGPNGYSGESYANANADVIKDINAMADKVGTQMQLQFTTIAGKDGGYTQVLGSIKNLSSSQGLNNLITPDFLSDAQTKFTEQDQKLKSQMKMVVSELGNQANFDYSSVTNPQSVAFENDLATVEKGIKNQCLHKSVDTDELLGRIYDPSASKFANKNTANFLKTKLKNILDNDKTTFETKMAELQSLEAPDKKSLPLLKTTPFRRRECSSRT